MTKRWNKGNLTRLAWLKERVSYQGDDCLVWPFCKDSRVNRGRVWDGERQWWAHRLMCVLAHGDPPTPKHQATHTCGKGHYSCVNPRHLRWGTNSENQLDRRKNGNMLRNRGGARPSISQTQVAEIYRLRAQHVTQVEIGRRIGVSLGCVQYWLKYRETRGHDQEKIKWWRPEEDAYLRQHVRRHGDLTRAAKALGRTVGSVHGRAQQLGVSTRKRS